MTYIEISSNIYDFNVILICTTQNTKTKMNENAWQIVSPFCKSLWPFKLYMSMTYLLISWFKVQQSSCRWLDTLMRKCLQIRELYCFWANKIWHNLRCDFPGISSLKCPPLTHEVKKWMWRIHLHKIFRRCILWKTLNVDPCLAQWICDDIYFFI